LLIILLLPEAVVGVEVFMLVVVLLEVSVLELHQ
jgi:hypothetical protein